MACVVADAVTNTQVPNRSNKRRFVNALTTIFRSQNIVCGECWTHKNTILRISDVFPVESLVVFVLYAAPPPEKNVLRLPFSTEKTGSFLPYSNANKD